MVGSQLDRHQQVIPLQGNEVMFLEFEFDPSDGPGMSGQEGAPRRNLMSRNSIRHRKIIPEVACCNDPR